MTDTTALAPTSSPALTPVAARPLWSRWSWLAVAAVAAAGVWLSWSAQQRVTQLESELVKRQQDSQSQAQEARLLARQAQDTARDAAARAALLDTRLAEVALQRSQVEDLIKSMSRSRDENLVVDIEAALRVAMQQASLSGSAEPLVSALQTADERLARTQQPRLDPVRRAVAKDLDRLKATRVADLPTLAIRLDEAIRLVDELPLLQAPVSTRTPAPASAGKSTPGASAAAATTASAPWSDRLLHWGQQASRVVWQEAQGLIRVTRIDKPDAMLLAPDQAFFLRENLKLRLLNARLGLLSRQTGTATADLQSARQSIDRYFDTRSRKTQLIQGLLGDISTQSPQTQVPRPDDTLAALAAIAGGR
ncbi:MAG TPA: uroporphyrinogen-III C-methyltransferase [Aquabacterium sp.]|uniref:uroporphyrinogen-III C-methyltransferase n=1 Tax=Aquabacterium sp. TaxID=1872578 RepID=UPI002E3741C1|nr:uroporphyrinogen-III C-methyltransferase [Aquabacterium sp.]HEX5373671.1 uroporphyrinogen-III C-methyltransferase [Aquabacterium sp.]